MPDLPLLERAAAGLVAAAAQGREAIDVGAFRAFFSALPEPFLSVALPNATGGDWDASIADLEAAFAARGRVPRLEVFAELYPDLGSALLRAGFAQDDAAPVMVLSAQAFAATSGDVLVDAAYLPLTPEDGLLERFLYAQYDAYGGLGGSALGWLPNLRSGLAEGYILGAALERSGELVAGATLLLGGDVAELAGVWTQVTLRRQGLAERVCRPLLAKFFATYGSLCWLSAAPGAAGLYRRLGFREVGTQLNFSKGLKATE